MRNQKSTGTTSISPDCPVFPAEFNPLIIPASVPFDANGNIGERWSSHREKQRAFRFYPFPFRVAFFFLKLQNDVNQSNRIGNGTVIINRYGTDTLIESNRIKKN